MKLWQAPNTRLAAHVRLRGDAVARLRPSLTHSSAAGQPVQSPKHSDASSIGLDLNAEYLGIAQRRIEAVTLPLV